MRRIDGLLPCPFCGGAPRVVTEELGQFVIRCDNIVCAARSSPTHDKDELRTCWNRRAGGGEISAGLLQSLFAELCLKRSRAISSLDRAARRVKHAALLEACGYQGDPHIDAATSEVLRDAYDDAATMVQALMDAVREHNEAVP